MPKNAVKAIIGSPTLALAFTHFSSLFLAKNGKSRGRPALLLCPFVPIYDATRPPEQGKGSQAGAVPEIGKLLPTFHTRTYVSNFWK